MMHTIRQWISRALALCLIGPIAAGFAQRVFAPDGSGAHTMLTGDALGSGMLALMLVTAMVLVMGVVGGTLGGRREGLLCMGFVLGWVGWTSGRLGQVYQLAPDVLTSVMLAMETFVLMLGVVFAGSLLSRDRSTDGYSSFAFADLRAWLVSKPMLGALGAGFVGAAVIAWLFGRTDLPGQAVGVGLLAGIFAGVLGAMASASLSEKDGHKGTPLAPMMLGMMLCGMIAPLVGIVFPGLGELPALSVQGQLPGYLAVSPAAWVMGALLGVPIGHSWVEQTHAHQAQQKTAAAK
jgi:hypothetical protein